MPELGKLVQQEHTPVAQRNLSGSDVASAAHKPGKWIIVESHCRSLNFVHHHRFGTQIDGPMNLVTLFADSVKRLSEKE